MINLMTLQVPDAIVYSMFGLMLTTSVGIVWALIKLYFGHYEYKKRLDTHIEETDEKFKKHETQHQEYIEQREEDRTVWMSLEKAVSKLSGNFEMFLKKQ